MQGTTLTRASYLDDCMNPLKHCADVGVDPWIISAGTPHSTAHHANQLPVGGQVHQRTPTITLRDSRIELKGWN